MFTVTVELRTIRKSAVAVGARRALYELRQFRETYGVEPVVSDGQRTYTEAELREIIET